MWKENIGLCAYDLGFGNGSFKMTLKSHTTEERNR